MEFALSKAVASGDAFEHRPSECSHCVQNFLADLDFRDLPGEAAGFELGADDTLPTADLRFYPAALVVPCGHLPGHAAVAADLGNMAIPNGWIPRRLRSGHCLGAQLAISVHNCPVLADTRFPMSIFKRTQRKYVKKAYRVRNWREYEAGLRNRGSLTVWISLTAGKLVNWDAPRPRRAADSAIATLQHKLGSANESGTQNRATANGAKSRQRSIATRLSWAQRCEREGWRHRESRQGSGARFSTP